MSKDFDRWNKVKKNINNIESKLPFYEGQIWWCNAGVNVGHEIDGKHGTFERPFYILRKCNESMFIGIPCTTNIKTGTFAYILKILNWEFILNFSQIKSMSSKRLLRRMVNVSECTKRDIKNKFFMYINRKPTR